MEQKKVRYLLWASLAAVMAWVLFAAVGSRLGGLREAPVEALDHFGSVPDFSLTERSGRPIRLADLRGKIVLVNFIYTSCRDTCPLQSAEMARLQGELRELDDLRLVSISVDPERDTPEELARYAERFHADPERWLFLTGERDEIYRLAQQGFRVSAAPALDGGKPTGEILHSSRFVLMDGEGGIRGYYDSNDPEALRRVRREAKALARDGA
jgi:protein SCO1/2